VKHRQLQARASKVPQEAKQGADTPERDWAWVEATVWTERMLSALGNGVKGEKWFSLIDKVIRAQTLSVAWQKVASNGGAAGVDRQSIDRFAARSDVCLDELSKALKQRRYVPQPVRRLMIPKGDGKARPLGIRR